MRYRHIRSDIAGNVPTFDEIKVGELAVNFTDKELYTKNNNNEVIALIQHQNFYTKDEINKLLEVSDSDSSLVYTETEENIGSVGWEIVNRDGIMIPREPEKLTKTPTHIIVGGVCFDLQESGGGYRVLGLPNEVLPQNEWKLTQWVFKSKVSVGDNSSTINVDLSEYYTKNEVDQLLRNVSVIDGKDGKDGKDGVVDYTKVEQMIKQAIAGLVNTDSTIKPSTLKYQISNVDNWNSISSCGIGVSVLPKGYNNYAILKLDPAWFDDQTAWYAFDSQFSDSRAYLYMKSLNGHEFAPRYGALIIAFAMYNPLTQAFKVVVGNSKVNNPSYVEWSIVDVPSLNGESAIVWGSGTLRGGSVPQLQPPNVGVEYAYAKSMVSNLRPWPMIQN